MNLENVGNVCEKSFAPCFELALRVVSGDKKKFTNGVNIFSSTSWD